CAVTPADLAHGVSARLDRKEVIALETGTLDAILAGFLEVARVIDATAAGEALVARVRRDLTALAEKTRELARPRAACLEWIDPVFPMGNWGPELVHLAGGMNAIGTAGQRSASTSWEAVRHADPDVLIVAPCGFGLARAESEMHVFAERPGWRDLRAV